MAMLLAACLLLLQQEIPYDTTILNPDRVETVDTIDLTGDGHPDLVLMSARRAQFFTYTPGAGFSKDPDSELTFEADVYLWTTATFADVKGPQIVSFSVRGIRRHLRDGKKWTSEDLIICPSIFAGNAQVDAAPLAVDFMRDLDGDGLSDAIFFRSDEIWIFPQKKQADGRPGFSIRQKLPVPTTSLLQMAYGAHEKFRQTLAVPMMVVGDMNGDKRLDIVYFHEDAVGTFLQREDGRFEAADRKGFASEKKKNRNTFLKFEAPPRMADFNADGMLDVALPNPRDGRVTVYFNRQGRADFATPDRSLKVEGWSTGVYDVDLDGDGKIELMMGEVKKLGIVSGIGAFLSKKIGLLIHFFKIDDLGNYATDPAQILEFAVPYTFSATRDSVSIDLKFWPTFDADVDGDGIRDLLIQNGDAELGVFRGSRTTCMEDSIGRTIKLNPPPGTGATKLEVADFNKDGASDLVIRYHNVETKRTVVEVKLSRKP